MSGIKALPDSTVRMLSSAQVVLTPLGIVKELIENSLDAGATNISVEIDRTTVGRIQVRDNGCGILGESDDCYKMCMRYSTSKIDGFEDLVKVKTFGFRGEALASIASLSKSMEITSRVKDVSLAEKEDLNKTNKQIGYRWKVCNNGCIDKTIGIIKVSAQPGTIISLQGIFNSIPVRKNVFLKESSKCINRIKEMIFNYAIFQKNLRISFKVLSASISGVTFSTMGERLSLNIISQYLNCSKDLLKSLIRGEREFEGGWKFEYVLSNDNEEQTNVDEKGGIKGCVVFAIDDRPLDSQLKTAKRLIKSTRECGIKCGKKSGYVLICNIQCPVESYDVNIEPSKGDVLFYNIEEVVQMWQETLGDVYLERMDKGEVDSQLEVDEQEGEFENQLENQLENQVEDQLENQLENKLANQLESQLENQSEVEQVDKSTLESIKTQSNELFISSEDSAEESIELDFEFGGYEEQESESRGTKDGINDKKEFKGLRKNYVSVERKSRGMNRISKPVHESNYSIRQWTGGNKNVEIMTENKKDIQSVEESKKDGDGNGNGNGNKNYKEDKLQDRMIISADYSTYNLVEVLSFNKDEVGKDYERIKNIEYNGVDYRVESMEEKRRNMKYTHKHGV